MRYARIEFRESNSQSNSEQNRHVVFATCVLSGGYRYESCVGFAQKVLRSGCVATSAPLAGVHNNELDQKSAAGWQQVHSGHQRPLPSCQMQ